ncbi:LARP6 family protein [Megaselia abdita]
MSSQAIPLKYVNARDYELNHSRIEQEELQLLQEPTAPPAYLVNASNEHVTEKEEKNSVSVVPLNNIKSSKNNESESSKVTTTTQTPPQQELQQKQSSEVKQQQQENQQPADVVTARKFSSSADILASIENQLNIIMPLSTSHKSVCNKSVATEKLIEFDETAPASEAEDELKPLMTDNHSPEGSTVIMEKPITFNANAPVFSPSYRTQMILADKRDSIDSNCSEENHKMYLSDGKVYPSDGYASNGKVYHSDNQKYPSDGKVYLSDNQKYPSDTKTYQSNSPDIAPDVLEIDTIDTSDIPSDLFSEELVDAVEFYFSNESILKDAFLLKHVRRNKEGYVSLKLVSSFKRVRQLTKDWRVVGQAIRKKGRRIELNDICTKIRRIEPLPNFDETMPSRTIVACDLPLDKLTIEKVSDMFAQCGEIALIRILKPGMGIPVDVRQFMNKYPELQEKECALVEFIESNSARNAKNLPYQVFDMVAPKKKTGRKLPNGSAPEGRMTKMIESYKSYEQPHHQYERNRGGSFSLASSAPQNENKYINKYHQNHHHSNHYNSNNSLPYQNPYQQQAAQHIFQRNNNSGYSDNYNRRFSNGSVTMLEDRRFSSCSEGYSSCSDMSRRPSGYSTDDSRRNSAACSDIHCSCAGSRRLSQCSDVYRRLSNGSDYGRRFSNNNVTHQLERSYSNPTTEAFMARRKDSLDSSYDRNDRKLSVGSQGSMCESLNSFHNFQNYRKCSNGFDRKMSSESHYINGRRLSSDSGYDRRMSFGSDSENYGSPRSRANSFLTSGNNQYKCTDNIVRSPIGPDGSKGFASRARKFGQIVPPV